MGLIIDDLGLPSFFECVALVLVGIALYVWCRLLQRGVATRGFCVWLPIAMMALLALVTWLDRVAGPTLDVVSIFVVVMNAPGLILVCVPGMFLMEYLPTPARLPVAAVLFWASWYGVLRLLQWRERLQSPIVLSLSE